MLTLFFLLPACARYVPPRYDPAFYPSSSQLYDLSFFWRIDRGDDRLDINGFIKNKIHSYIRDVELRAAILDDQKQQIGKEQVFFFLNTISMDELAPFGMSFPVPAEVNARSVKFIYRYHLVDRDSQVPYFHTFETDIR